MITPGYERDLARVADALETLAALAVRFVNADTTLLDAICCRLDDLEQAAARPDLVAELLADGVADVGHLTEPGGPA